MLEWLRVAVVRKHSHKPGQRQQRRAGADAALGGLEVYAGAEPQWALRFGGLQGGNTAIEAGSSVGFQVGRRQVGPRSRSGQTSGKVLSHQAAHASAATGREPF